MNKAVNTMDDLHGYYYEDLKEGMTDTFSKTVTEADITNFADISGDTNPAHLNKEFAAKTIFKDCIAHGMLSVGFISAALGTKLPGPGAIYVAQNLRFKAPVKAGDTVTARVTVTKLVPEKRFVELETVCTVNDKPVIIGEATMMVSSREA